MRCLNSCVDVHLWHVPFIVVSMSILCHGVMCISACAESGSIGVRFE